MGIGYLATQSRDHDITPLGYIVMLIGLVVAVFSAWMAYNAIF